MNVDRRLQRHLQEHRGHRRLYESEAALELGCLRWPSAVSQRRLRSGRCDHQWPNRVRRAGSDLPADLSRRERDAGVPFSKVHRIEVGGWVPAGVVRPASSDHCGQREDRELLSNTTETTSLADTLHLASTTVASVYDTSIAGATSPMSGQRSRFEVTPTMDRCPTPARWPTTVAISCRRAFTPSPAASCTTAAMGVTPRIRLLLPLHVGYPELMRGYTLGFVQFQRMHGWSRGIVRDARSTARVRACWSPISSCASRCCGHSA